MQAFVTGGSGWIGSAVIPQLLATGHGVTALARSQASADALADAGASAVIGSLDDLDVLRREATAADGVIHLAFNHEIAFAGDFMGAAVSDRQAVEAMGGALVGSGRPLVIASGTPVNRGTDIASERDGHVIDENATGDPGMLLRAQTAEWTLALADHNVRSVVVRLPPTNHGQGDEGFVAALARAARERSASGYIGDGSVRWSATHRLDTATVFRLAVEQAPAGTTLHAVAENAIPTREIAEAIGQALKLPVVSVAPERAFEHFGWIAGPLSTDRAASSVLTQEMLGWQPVQPTLIADIEAGFYPG